MSVAFGSFPTAVQLQDASEDSRELRKKVAGSLCAALLLSALVAVAARKYGSDAPQEKRFRYGGLFSSEDLRFVTYQTLLVSTAYSVAVFSGLTGRASLEYGLDFEIWVAAFLEAMLTTTICAFVRPISTSKVLLSVAPFSVRFDLVRDATLVAIFVREKTLFSCLGAATMICATLLATSVSYGDRMDFVELRRSFWAEDSPPQRLEEIFEKDLLEALQAGGERVLLKATVCCSISSASSSEAPYLEDQEAEALVSYPMTTSEVLWQKLVALAVESTSHAKQLKGLYESIPQAMVSTTVSFFMAQTSPAVLVCVVMAWLQVIFIYWLRPFALCAQAENGLCWSNTSVRDFRRARACRWWGPLGSAALAAVALDEENSPELRSGAAAALCQAGEEVEPGFRNLQEVIFKRLVQQEDHAAVTVVEALAHGALSQDPELSVAPGKAKKWRLLAAILQRSTAANVNFMDINAEILKKLLAHLSEDLPLESLNLNDNKNLCKTQEGIDRVVEFLQRCPRLRKLRLQRTGISDNLEGQAMLKRAWGKREAKLLEF